MYITSLSNNDAIYILKTLSNNGTPFSQKKIKCATGFSKTLLKPTVNHNIEKFYFDVGNIIMKQSIAITKGINRAPFLEKSLFGFV